MRTTSPPRHRRQSIDATRTPLATAHGNGDPPAKVAAWAAQLHAPDVEPVRSRRMAHAGGIAAIGAVLVYLTWRIAFTLPVGGWNLAIAWMLVSFEALPVAGLVLKTVTLWNIDSLAPEPVTAPPAGMRVAVLIPTYNEPIEVLAPTVAAACALEPAHQTWVLDDGDRDWVAEMCAAFGARYVRRPEHDHAKAGNMNHALDLMAAEQAAGAAAIDIIAVLDCDHVPLPTFLTATLGWFADEEIALVQGPQNFYNSGAFDDDGVGGEQGLFFNVLMAARHHAGAGPFWCGSTSLLRVKALREVGGVATETITEDMHTTLKLIRLGWKTAYHHQTLAVGLAPATPAQYMLQRRRWGMGAMQILTHQRLWAAKKWMSWRNFYEYINGTLWWLEGIATLIAFIVPAVVMLTGAQTSTAPPAVFAAVFVAMFATRLWGAKRLMRHQIHWPTAFALRIFRVPIGVACLWWLVSRKTLEFEVTPKGAADERTRGRSPRILVVLTAAAAATISYATAGTLGWVPWRTNTASTVAAGVWLALAALVLVIGTARIRAAEYATSRRNAHRIPLRTGITINGTPGELVDISVGGAAVRFPAGTLPDLGLVELELPGAGAIKMSMIRMPAHSGSNEFASLRAVEGDWAAIHTMSQWLFHTPTGAVPALPQGVPAIAYCR
jgi:cellulose synthase (UDP-forming)